MVECDLSVVIPAYNEERRLPRTLTSVISYLESQSYSSEILIVTDGSTDATVDVCKSFAKSYPALKVLSFPERRGKGFGTRTGILSAIGKARLYMDADLAVPIEFVEPCLAKLKQGFNIVIGSRTEKGAKILKAQTFPRHELAVIFGVIQRTMLSLPIVDTQCGFKLYSAEAAEKYFPLTTLDCAFFDTEVLYLAYHLQEKIAAVPVTWSHDHYTRLPIGWKRSLELLSILHRLPKIHRSTLANAISLQK